MITKKNFFILMVVVWAVFVVFSSNARGWTKGAIKEAKTPMGVEGKGADRMAPSTAQPAAAIAAQTANPTSSIVTNFPSLRPSTGVPSINDYETLHCANRTWERIILGEYPNIVQNTSLDNTTLTIYTRFPAFQQSIGNSMSEYFGKLSFAILGGYNFRAAAYDPTLAGFLSHFPEYIRAVSPRKEAFQRVCTHCTHLGLVHVCDYGWSDIVDLARLIIQNAARSFLSENGLTVPSYQEDDWLIYDRMLLPRLVPGEGGFGVCATSLYAHLPQGTYTIYILESPRQEGKLDLYKLLLSERDRFLATMRPNVTVVKLAPQTISVDFARIVFAPNLLLTSTGSSWSLWSAVGNQNRVLTAPFRQIMDFNVYPSNVQLLVDQRVLRHPNMDSATAALYNLSGPIDDSWFDTEEGRNTVLNAYADIDF